MTCAGHVGRADRADAPRKCDECTSCLDRRSDARAVGAERSARPMAGRLGAGYRYDAAVSLGVLQEGHRAPLLSGRTPRNRGSPSRACGALEFHVALLSGNVATLREPIWHQGTQPQWDQQLRTSGGIVTRCPVAIAPECVTEVIPVAVRIQDIPSMLSNVVLLNAACLVPRACPIASTVLPVLHRFSCKKDPGSPCATIVGHRPPSTTG